MELWLPRIFTETELPDIVRLGDVDCVEEGDLREKDFIDDAERETLDENVDEDE